MASPSAWAQAEAQQAVEGLHSVLLEVMKAADELRYAGRHDRLAPVIRDSFDLPFISKSVLGGRRWGALSDAQRATMLKTFSELSVATYAHRFDGYDGEQFETLGVQSLKRGRVLVSTEIKESDGSAHQLKYVLHQQDGRWRIVNVIADGVSDLSLKRADYAAVIKQDGFDALIGKIEAQIADYASGGSEK